MAIAPPDSAKALFESACASSPNLAKQLILKSYDDPQCNTLRLAIFWSKNGFSAERYGFDVSYAQWEHDREGCVEAIRGWIAGVLQHVTSVSVLPVGMDTWTTDAPPKVKTRPAAGAKQQPKPAPAPEPAPLPVPGERHIEIE